MTGLDFEEMLDIARKHRILIGSLVGIGVSFAAMRRYFAGGVCRSKARLDGKTVIITGANTGIGKETAIDLASRGAKVILACRDVMRAERAATDIMKKSNNQNIVVKIVDLASLDSIRKFADNINKSEPKIDILINNAGIMMCPYWKTQDGFEMQFGVNHLGHFLLTNLLLDKIKSSAPARIINVSSRAHTRTDKLDFDDLNSEKKLQQYGSLPPEQTCQCIVHEGVESEIARNKCDSEFTTSWSCGYRADSLLSSERAFLLPDPVCPHHVYYRQNSFTGSSDHYILCCRGKPSQCYREILQ